MNSEKPPVPSSAQIDMFDEDGIPTPEATPLDFERLSVIELEALFKGKLESDGKYPYGSHGISREMVIEYLKGEISAEKILEKLAEIARDDDKDDINATYRR